MNPIEHIRADSLMCQWDTAPFLLFSSEVEPLVYYSHLFPAIAVLILAIVVLYRSNLKLTSRLFFSISVLFAIFAIFDLILWATEKPELIMFLWSTLTYIEPLIYALVLYLFLVFSKQRDMSVVEKVLVFLLFVPILLLGPTSLNIAGFDYTNCWRLAIEGPIATYYTYFIEAVFALWLLVSGVITVMHSSNAQHKKRVTLLLIGSLFFLLAFSSGNIFGTLLQGVMGEEAWVIGQYGFFGMPIFLGFIMYLMVNFEFFAARIIYAEVLILSSFVALLSLIFIPDQATARPVLLLTIVMFGFLGYFLVKGVKRDIEQKEQLEHLTEQLAKANKRLKMLDQMKSEFVSVASHQLRSPLTSIRGYASMLLEGSFGKLTDKSKEAVGRIAESSRYMAMSVEDYLNVSRIEAGRMRYELSDFNLKDIAEKIVDDQRAIAVKKGLILTFKSSNLDSRGMVYADVGKTQQMIHNILDNAIKYTPHGSITVTVNDDTKKKKVYVSITDTGVGMDSEAIEEVFEKFIRAKNANTVNVTGTGLGLYVAKRMAEQMNGTITASSPGEGEGSTFTLELPMSGNGN